MPSTVRRHGWERQSLQERLPDLDPIVRIKQRPAAALPRQRPGQAFAARRKDADQFTVKTRTPLAPGPQHGFKRLSNRNGPHARIRFRGFEGLSVVFLNAAHMDLIAAEVDIRPSQAEHLADPHASQEGRGDKNAIIGVGFGGGDHQCDLLRHQDLFLGLAAHAIELGYGRRLDIEILGGEVEGRLKHGHGPVGGIVANRTAQRVVPAPDFGGLEVGQLDVAEAGMGHGAILRDHRLADISGGAFIGNEGDVLHARFSVVEPVLHGGGDRCRQG